MNTARGTYTPEKRRGLVAIGIRAGKSNRAIAKQLGVDEGTIRRDRAYLETPEHDRPTKRERTRKDPKPMYTIEDLASVMRQKGRVIKAVRHWIAEQHLVLHEIEYVIHEAGKRLFVGSDFVKTIPVPTEKPDELLITSRPNPEKWEDLIPNPDYWADWLARWLALCLPGQGDLYDQILRETSQWARDRAAGFVY